MKRTVDDRIKPNVPDLSSNFETTFTGSILAESHAVKSSVGNGSTQEACCWNLPSMLQPIEGGALSPRRRQRSGMLSHQTTTPNNVNFSSRSTSSSPTQFSDLTPGELLLASEMTQLSIKDRETVFENIHGVSAQLEETPELRAQSTAALKNALESIKKGREAFDKVLFLRPGLLNDEAFLLLFLRAACFEVRKATTNILAHFETKLMLFGIKNLAKDIMWNDLPEADQKTMANIGAYHIFKGGKDKMGRLIVCDMYANWSYQNELAQIRIMWYLCMSAIQRDVEAQIKGLVIVGFALGATPSFLYQAAAIAKYKLEVVLPFRTNSFHMCFADERFRPFFSLLMAALPKDIRLRTKTHFGSSIEIIYSLCSYGLTASKLPFDSDGQLKEELYRERLAALRQEDEDHESSQTENYDPINIPYPLPADILLGRGRPFQEFPGNYRLQDVLRQHKAEYDAIDGRKAKTRISLEIVRKLDRENVRFLKRRQGDDAWEKVSEDVAREKVAMGFRNLSRRTKTP